jgi:hypothetical protein
LLVDSLAEEEAFDGADDEMAARTSTATKTKKTTKKATTKMLRWIVFLPMLLLVTAVIVLPLLQGAPRKGPQHQPLLK